MRLHTRMLKTMFGKVLTYQIYIYIYTHTHTLEDLKEKKFFVLVELGLGVC